MIINNISTDFKYESTADTMQISTDFALRLLKEYRITVSDFKDKAKAFNEDGSIKPNAIVTLKKLNIGKKTQSNIDAVIVKGIDPDVLIGSKTLSKFGDFTIDEDKKQLNFETGTVVPEGGKK